MNRQFVTMRVGDQTIAAPVEDVREILDVRKVSSVPGANAASLGMIDVRGESVAVFDLRSLLAMPDLADTELTRLVVFAGNGEGKLSTALRTDAVIEVAALDDEDLQLPPSLGGGEVPFVEGIGRINGQFVTVLDFSKLLAGGGGDISP